jgi:hypothetical protein
MEVQGLDRNGGGRGDHVLVPRHHGREGLERAVVAGVGDAGVAGGAAGGGGPTHPDHFVLAMVPLEQAQGRASHRRLRQEKGGQGEEGEPAGAKGQEHQGQR